MINGSGGNPKFTGVTYVAFSTESGMHYEYPVSGSNPPITVNNSTGKITLNYLPSVVRDTQEVWWVRVSKNSSNPTSWTAPTDALSLQVGSPLLTCAGVSNSGNFGTLDLPSIDPSASGEKAIEWNILIRRRLQPDHLSRVGKRILQPRNRWRHRPAQQRDQLRRFEDGLRRQPCHCWSDRGQRQHFGRADQGEYAYRVCPEWRIQQLHHSKIKGADYSINDDTLTCYFKNNATTIAQVSNASYSGAPLVSGDVFSSPRFWWVPVFKVQPSNGSSHNYSIIDFRPSFITGELAASTKSLSVMDVNTDNGLAFASNGIKTLKVVFFASEHVAVKHGFQRNHGLPRLWHPRFPAYQLTRRSRLNTQGQDSWAEGQYSSSWR